MIALLHYLRRSPCAKGWMVRWLRVCLLCGIQTFAFAASAEGPYTCDRLESAERGNLTMTQGADGWFFRTGADLHDDFYVSAETKRHLRRLSDALHRKETTLVFVPVPPRALVHPDHLDLAKPRQSLFDVQDTEQTFNDFIIELRETGIRVPNLLASWRASEAEQPFYFKRDTHWTPAGARMSAQVVASTIDQTANDAAPYVTKAAGALPLKGKMAEVIRGLCDDPVPLEEFQQYATSLAAQGSADDLFGDTDAAASLALVGSSFSAVAWFNFDGFLAETTGLEVANHAISGGQLFNALISYLSGPAFHRQPPRFLVWEAPAYYNLDRDSLTAFRQIIPAVFGACKPASAVAKGDFQITHGQAAEQLRLQADKGVSGSRYYVYLETPNKGLSQFTLTIRYADGDQEWFAVDRSENFQNSGRFFVEFSDDIDSPVTSISLEQLPNINADVTARVCRTPSA